ncbi:hypothetical protein BC829DRAFT_406631 [Chytridium lagenaria]|nr:hypothetical protein BC829DRAFT_406631 [Chytridium lagenaria]
MTSPTIKRGGLPLYSSISHTSKQPQKPYSTHPYSKSLFHPATHSHPHPHTLPHNFLHNTLPHNAGAYHKTTPITTHITLHQSNITTAHDHSHSDHFFIHSPAMTPATTHHTINNSHHPSPTQHHHCTR